MAVLKVALSYFVLLFFRGSVCGTSQLPTAAALHLVRELVWDSTAVDGG